jgi:hypothetical protein
MNITRTHNGPIDEYLRVTGKTIEVFQADLKKGDPATASIFAAEILYKSIQDLTVAIENIPSTDD